MDKNQLSNPSNDISSDLVQHDIFPSVTKNDVGSVLQSEKQYSFHVWTKPKTSYHSHDNYIEIFIVTEGKLIHRFENKDTVMHVGDAFLILPGQYHKHLPYENYESQHINITCNLQFARELFKLFFGTPDFSFLRQLTHLNSKEFETVSDYRRLLLESKDETYGDILVKSFIAYMIGMFYLPEEQIKMPEWLREFLRKLNDLDFENESNLSEIYASSNYSQTTLAREFKKYTGQTLISYVNDLKLSYACNLLKNTSFDMLTVSNKLGYSSLSHFNHVFKTKYGITPLQYRKEK